MDTNIKPRMPKPRVRKLLDDYALRTGQHWACDNGLFVARGTTPGEAVDKLADHMAWLRWHRKEAFGHGQPVGEG